MKKKLKSKPRGGGRTSGSKLFSPNPNISATTGHKRGSMPLPKHHSSGAGLNKAGGGSDSSSARSL